METLPQSRFFTFAPTYFFSVSKHKIKVILLISLKTTKIKVLFVILSLIFTNERVDMFYSTSDNWMSAVRQCITRCCCMLYVKYSCDFNLIAAKNRTGCLNTFRLLFRDVNLNNAVVKKFKKMKGWNQK
jgi:hypothetical protein